MNNKYGRQKYRYYLGFIMPISANVYKKSH